ncbi:CPBP family intramembrane metalloprotease [Halovulum dunhuangense]|uniref:CPBP family intramembrane metalloprotease n=1 Tax=Halovulum dunhuangense TaxID=1505036 RepID=A0A849KQS7_9RHOB|nr:type II CAAX endopeptidase family protein [Halovulum dunhuangense]NNU79219.1 CPBP family intramembrane metalloprotease [Halovulum dunhuangense]
MSPAIQAYLDQTAPLAGRATLWRWLLTGAFVVAGQTAATVAIFYIFAQASSLATGAPLGQSLAQIAGMGSPLSLVAILLTFSGFILGIMLGLRLLHRSRLGPILSRKGGFAWREFFHVSALFLALGIGAVGISHVFQDYNRNLSLGVWLFWLAPALVATFVQVFAEELVFRGYLQSQLAARFRSPLIWIGGPAVIFGALHLPNAAAFGANGWLVLLAPMLIGVIAGHVTARTGGIAAATGIHFANNCLGLLIVAVPGPFGALSLWLHPIDLSDIATVRPMILLNIGLILAAYGVYLLLIRRRDARLQPR